MSSESEGGRVGYLVNAFYIFFAGTCLAMGLAFGLGSRELAGNIAASTWKTEQKEAKVLSQASELGDQIWPLPSNTNGKGKRRTKRA